MKIKPIKDKWKGTMTDRERFVKQMHYEKTDRCFNMEFGYWQDNFEQWKIFRDNNITSNSEADIFFNFDPVHDIRGNNWMDPPFPEKIISETADKRILMNGDGLTAELPKDGHATIPHYLNSSVKTPDDWKRVKEERFQLDSPGRKIDIEELKKKHPPDRTYPLGIFCGSFIGKIRDMLTFEGLAYAVYDYPDMVEDMVEQVCLLVEQNMDALLPHFSFDFASGWEDIAFKNGPIVSIDFFKSVIVPRYKRIRKKLDEYGIDIWYTDCDGDIRPLIPYFMEGGINCMFPFEVNGSGHPGEVLAEYGPELRIMGGVDKMELRKGKEAIKSYLESLEGLVEKGGFIPFCDHRCPPDVDENDYLYYLDLKEKMFGI